MTFMVRDSVMARFLSKVKAVESGCIDWQDSLDKNGYGRFWYTPTKKFLLAHRVSWMIYRGLIPDDLFVCHSCDRPCCVNDEHLFLGTQFDNMHDCSVKGRTGNVTGERHGRAKLTDAQVIEIRELCEAGVTLADIASQFGLGFMTVSCIVRGLTWKKTGGPIRGNAKYKLTEQDVRDIRATDLSITTRQAVAAKFGVSVFAISDIVAYRRWKNVT